MTLKRDPLESNPDWRQPGQRLWGWEEHGRAEFSVGHPGEDILSPWESGHKSRLAWRPR
jgi:hypothetical protein